MCAKKKGGVEAMLIFLFIFAALALILLVLPDLFQPEKCNSFHLFTKAKRTLSVVSRLRLLRELVHIPGWNLCSGRLKKAVQKKQVLLTSGEADALLFLLLELGALVLGWLVASFVAWIVLSLAAPFFVLILAKQIGKHEQEAVQKALPDAYRSLAGSLSSGQTLPQSFAYVGRHTKDPVGAAFRKASWSFFCGGTLQESFCEIEKRLADSSSHLLVCALSVSQKTGAPLAELLNQAALLIEERFALKQLLKTKTAQVRISVEVVMVLPVVLVLGLAFLSPDFQKGLLTPLGIVCLGIAAALDIMALFSMKKILEKVELS